MKDRLRLQKWKGFSVSNEARNNPFPHHSNVLATAERIGFGHGLFRHHGLLFNGSLAVGLAIGMDDLLALAAAPAAVAGAIAGGVALWPVSAITGVIGVGLGLLAGAFLYGAVIIVLMLFYAGCEILFQKAPERLLEVARVLIFALLALVSISLSASIIWYTASDYAAQHLLKEPVLPEDISGTPSSFKVFPKMK